MNKNVCANYEKDNYQFDFDLERMKRAVEGAAITPPNNLKTASEILEWLKTYKEEENDQDA